jgi:hypothetical protein
MKTKLLKNRLIVLSLIVCTSSFGQIDYTFDTDDEGFTVNGPGSSSSHSTATGILTAVTGNGSANLQLRKNANDVGDPTTLTGVVIDLKNNSNANSIILQTVSGGTTNIAEIDITAADTAEQSYTINVPDPSPTWIGSFQLRVRFVNVGGNLDGGSIEINRIQIVDPTTLSTEELLANNFSIYPNPASDFVNVKSLQGANIEVYNIVGKLVKSEISQSNEHAMNVSDLNSGIYLLKLTSEDKSASKKLIIE